MKNIKNRLLVFFLWTGAIVSLALIKKKDDCPKLSLKEQGNVINEFLNDYGQWPNFKSSLRQNGYCLSQFGLPNHSNSAPNSLQYEMDVFFEVICEAELRCENLMNEFEPGSEKYEAFSQRLQKLRDIQNQ